MNKDNPTFFCSYAREDSEFVLKLAKELREAGASLWLDQMDILGGQRWDEAVQAALASCPGILAVLSPSAVASQNFMDEVSYALEEEKQIIPVLYRDCTTPFRLRRVHHVEFTADYKRGFADLMRAMRLGLPPRTAASALTEAPAQGQPSQSATPEPRPDGEPVAAAPPDDARARLAWWKVAAGLLGVMVLVTIGVILFMKLSKESGALLPRVPAPQPPQAKGNLQLHFMDVGEADAALVISPGGQVAAFDAGADARRKGRCDTLQAYYEQLGVKRLDFFFVSHYHADHIGCITPILAKFPAGLVLDRGAGSTSLDYEDYQRFTSTGIHRSQARLGDRWYLDANSPNPVFLEVVGLNANGMPTTNENSLSLSVRLTYGAFRAELGGDVSGDSRLNGVDVETAMAPKVGKLDVYKVHHHCSQQATNNTWLAATKPTVAILSVGDGNPFRHPAAGCLERLHRAGVKTYWTERGNGAGPEPPWDVVGGNIVVQVDLSKKQYTVEHGTAKDTYALASAR